MAVNLDDQAKEIVGKFFRSGEGVDRKWIHVEKASHIGKGEWEVWGLICSAHNSKDGYCEYRAWIHFSEDWEEINQMKWYEEIREEQYKQTYIFF